MSDKISFDFEKIKEYACKTNQESMLKKNLGILSIISLFDQNLDNKISYEELSKVSKEDYNKYISEVTQYNVDTFETVPKDKLYSYDELSQIVNYDCIDSKILYTLNSLPEIKNLKITAQMTPDEIKKELIELKQQVGTISYSEKCVEGCDKDYLEALRERRILYDKNSNIVDGHIGTYLQGINMMCTLLSHLDTMSDEEIQSLYEEKVDENGNKYYEVTFPSVGSPVIITAQELDDGEITITEKGKKINLSDFSTGDRDIRMLEMAYIKQFGSDIYFHGAKASEVQNKFVKTGNTKYTYNENLEKIVDYNKIPKISIFTLLTSDSIQEKELPTERILSNGYVIKIYNNSALDFWYNDKFLYSINMHHTMQFRRYDSETNEIVLSGSNLENMSEIRIPAIPEVLAYFGMTAQFEEEK